MSRENKLQIYLIAHNIRSLYNVGSFFRSADCFAVDKIYLTGYTPDPTSNINPENLEECRQKKQISKTALGAEDWVPWDKERDIKKLIQELKNQGIKIYALETGKDTKNIYQLSPEFPCALVVGNEVDGVDQEILDMADATISIPMLGQKISLNVSVATGIALYELNR